MTTVTPSTQTVPAGWYRDPLGIPQLRWWDGIAWTNRIQEDRTESGSFAGQSGLNFAYDYSLPRASA